MLSLQLHGPHQAPASLSCGCCAIDLLWLESNLYVEQLAARVDDSSSGRLLVLLAEDASNASEESSPQGGLAASPNRMCIPKHARVSLHDQIRARCWGVLFAFGAPSAGRPSSQTPPSSGRPGSKTPPSGSLRGNFPIVGTMGEAPGAQNTLSGMNMNKHMR